jgi:hypothetical protein
VLRVHPVRAAVPFAIVALLVGCGNDSVPPSSLDDPDAYGASGVRRLTRTEVANSIVDVFGVDATDLMASLPEDLVGDSPFDNNYRAQTVSPTVISSYASFAQEYASRLAATPDLAMRLGSCTPASADDSACFEAIALRAGRLMFRRPLGAAELDAYGAVILGHARASGRFETAIEMLGLLLLQHPAFLYRLEQDGTLDDYQVATRMSFLLWGSVPDDALLDAAEAGDLLDTKTRVRQAERMLGDPRAQRNLHRFHALWLGFSDAPLPAAIAGELRDETNHLIDRVVFEEDADWLAIFNWNESYLTPKLAQQYGLPTVAGPGWTSYPADRGGGVLTHGSFLSLGSKFGDTSPTVRGAEIFRRLTCESLGTIPPNVDTDMPPGQPTDCKPQRYVMREIDGCMQCHGIIDNIGFGLENYGVNGQWRETEPDRPDCAIEAVGAWDGVAFSGTQQLGALIQEDPRVAACATTQLFRFMTGRDDDDGDRGTLDVLADIYDDNRSLRDLLVDLVAAPAIAHRKGE